MGVFGTGLYSGDFAMDLRSTVSAVCRLPLSPDRLLAILEEADPSAASNPGDEDHTVFWLVVADQFQRRGIDVPRARGRALDVIDQGLDSDMHRRLGMSERDLRTRLAKLQKLRAALRAPVVPRPRATLKQPQPFVLEIEGLYTYPVAGTRPINPYFGDRTKQPRRRPDGSVLDAWPQDGWGAALIVDRGRAFEYLAWYRALVITAPLEAMPTLSSVTASTAAWRLGSPGTCSAVHSRRIELGRLGRIRLDPVRARARLGTMKPGIYQAVHDISIVGQLATVGAGLNKRVVTVERLDEIGTIEEAGTGP